jgi:ABC-type cobalt transport system substrate-binding protein
MINFIFAVLGVIGAYLIGYVNGMAREQKKNTTYIHFKGGRK